MRRSATDGSMSRRFPSLAVLSFGLWVATISTLLSDAPFFQVSTCRQQEPIFRIRRHESQDAEAPLPRVAWLMSWPNSGTSYTLRLVRDITNLSTATNYGHEHRINDASILVHQKWINGPFRANVSQELPRNFILTKTHCGSRCVHCAPDGYLETPRTFQRSCQSGRRHFNSTWSKEAIYQPDIVSRAVHLIRNPMDNVVARFHLSRRHAGGGDKAFDNNATGFQAWCAKMDSAYETYESHTPWLDPPLLRLWKSVPCHAEFFKYIQWHDLAWDTAEHMDISMHLLRYEDYDRNWKGTVDALLSYLQLPVATWKGATPFVIQTYDSFYTSQQKRDIEALLRNVASARIWEIVSPYFHDDKV